MASSDKGEGDKKIKADIENREEEEMNELEEAVKKLYEFRDMFIETHGIEKADKKLVYLHEELNKVTAVFIKNKEYETKYRARYSYLKGRAYNVFPEIYCKDSEDLLSRAVKLKPSNVDAWNELAECLCKNREYVQAEVCLDRAMNIRRNKISLRDLSIMMRQKATIKGEDKITYLQKSLEFAKEAVAMDVTDGTSWMVLGNSHVMSYFHIAQNPKNVQHCLNAFKQAEKDVIAKSNPCLHYNKGAMLKYQQQYTESLDSIDLAIQLAPRWPVAKETRVNLLNYLTAMVDSLTFLEKMKNRKRVQFLKSIEEKQLGIYGEGKYQSTNGTLVNLKLTMVNDLEPGVNQGKVVLGKVICSISHEFGVPYTFCMADKAGTSVVVTLYNIDVDKFFIMNDFIAIPEPYVADFDFKYNDNGWKFRSIRLDNPLKIVINRRKPSSDLLSATQCKLTCM